MTKKTWKSKVKDLRRMVGNVPSSSKKTFVMQAVLVTPNLEFLVAQSSAKFSRMNTAPRIQCNEFLNTINKLKTDIEAEVLGLLIRTLTAHLEFLCFGRKQKYAQRDQQVKSCTRAAFPIIETPHKQMNLPA